MDMSNLKKGDIISISAIVTGRPVPPVLGVYVKPIVANGQLCNEINIDLSEVHELIEKAPEKIDFDNLKPGMAFYYNGNTIYFCYYDRFNKACFSHNNTAIPQVMTNNMGLVRAANEDLYSV